MFKVRLTLLFPGNKTIQRRVHHQKTDANLSLVLIFTILMFFMFHSPRVILSVYEATTIQNVLTCNGKRKGFYTIWYLYVQNTLQLVQVYLLSCTILLFCHLSGWLGTCLFTDWSVSQFNLDFSVCFFVSPAVSTQPRDLCYDLLNSYICDLRFSNVFISWLFNSSGNEMFIKPSHLHHGQQQL